MSPFRSCPAALYPVSDNAFRLLGVQLLDGVGAGIYQALTPLVIADIMRGTGRYNLAQGAVATTQGIGAAVSGLFVGEVVDQFGYFTAFFALAAAAAAAWKVFALFMPETREDSRDALKGETAVDCSPEGGTMAAPKRRASAWRT